MPFEWVATADEILGKSLSWNATSGSCWPATVTRVSLLCRWVRPGQPDGLEFCLGWQLGLSEPKSGGDEDAAELGEHVRGGRVGLGAVRGPAGALFGHVL